jgi:hypothetical protein
MQVLSMEDDAASNYREDKCMFYLWMTDAASNYRDDKCSFKLGMPDAASN